MFSPFEQFEILILLANPFGIDITNITLFIFFNLFVILTINYLALSKSRLSPTLLQYIIETVFLFVRSLLIEQAGKHSGRVLPFIFSVFLFFLFSNLFGLFPFVPTVTAQIAITFFFSFGFFLSYIVIGIIRLKLDFLKIFLPAVPMWLLPFMIIIEILSFMIRPISLAVRLFANMLAGHISLFIVASGFIVLSQMFFLLGLFPLIALIAFFLLEIFIAFLQAYVFTILLCIYLSDSYQAHH